MGLRMSAKTQTVLMVIKISMILMLIAALFMPSIHFTGANDMVNKELGNISWIQSFGMSLIAVSFTYGGYQQMVRSEVMRARFRNSFSEPSPLKANTLTNIDFKLQDVLHTFKKGHKIMVQVQSTAFPLFDINPQKYVPNIYQAKENDFVKATHRVFGTSSIEVMRLKE